MGSCHAAEDQRKTEAPGEEHPVTADQGPAPARAPAAPPPKAMWELEVEAQRRLEAEAKARKKEEEERQALEALCAAEATEPVRPEEGQAAQEGAEAQEPAKAAEEEGKKPEEAKEKEGAAKDGEVKKPTKKRSASAKKRPKSKPEAEPAAAPEAAPAEAPPEDAPAKAPAAGKLDRAAVKQREQAFKAKPEKEQEELSSQLRKSAKEGNHPLVKSMLDSGCIPDGADKDGWTALMEAAQAGSAECVGALLDFGANPKLTIKLGEYGMTALHYAARNGHLEVAEKLVPVSDLKIKNFQGKTAYEVAKSSGHKDIAKLARVKSG